MLPSDSFPSLEFQLRTSACACQQLIGLHYAFEENKTKSKSCSLFCYHKNKPTEFCRFSFDGAVNDVPTKLFHVPTSKSQSFNLIKLDEEKLVAEENVSEIILDR